MLGGLLAAVLLGGGVPHLVAALAGLAGEPALALIQAGERPTAAGIERIVDGRTTALAWAPDGRAEIEIGAVLLAMAGPADAAPQSRQHLARQYLEGAAARLQAGLAQAPADAQAWHLLATAFLALDRRAEAARALAMSFRADPHTVQFGSARILLGVRLWDGLDRGLQAAVLRELRTSFRLDPAEAMRIAIRAGSLPILRQALAGDVQDAQALEIILEDHRAATS